MKIKNLKFIIKKSYRFFTKTRLRKVLSSVLALLILLTSFKFLFFSPKEVKAADVYLGFNEGYGTSANDNNSTVSAGTITNATWKTDDLCRNGKCLYFDGDGDYVSFADDADLDFAGSDTGTFEGWFRHTPIAPTVDIDHQTGDLTQYTSTVTDSGDLSASTASAMNGTSYGMQALIDDATSIYATKSSIGSTSDYTTIKYYFDPNSLTMANGNGFATHYLYNNTSQTLEVLLLNYWSDAYHLSFGVYDDTSTPTWPTDTNLSDAPHLIEIHLKRATTSTSSDGWGRYYVDGVLQASVTGIDNYDRYATTGSTTLGASSIDVGTSGTIYFDELEVYTGTSQTILSKYETTGADGGYKVQMENDGDINCGIDNDNAGYPSDYAASTTANYDDNKWHYFSCVKDGSTSLSLYLDTNLISTDSSITSSTLANDDSFYVGIDGDGASNDYQGFIDEVKVMRSARTAAQIKADFTGETPSRGTSASFGGESQSFLSDGLVGYWKMDEAGDATRTDYSGNGNTMTETTGDTIDQIAGKFGYAGDFENSASENERLEITDASQKGLDITGALTLCAWIKPETVAYKNVAGKFANPSDLSYLLHTNTDGSIKFYASYDGTNYYNADSAASVLTAGTWAHVCGQYDGSFIRTYVNGLPSGTPVTYTSGIHNGAADFDIGGAWGDYFDGVIDEVRIYNRALSPSEVQALYNWTPGPVGYWKLDENTSTVANDSSGNDNAATLTNTPIWTVGKYGSGVSFAGSDQHITRADDADFDFADDADMTLETWFKHGTASAQEIILSKYQEAGYKIIMESDGDITCALDYDSTWTPTDSATSAAATYDDGNWHHIACVKIGAASLTLYIDGIPKTTDSSITATNTLTNADPIYFGVDADGTSNDFTGTLDEIKIYNYARTSGQIYQDMNAGHPAPGSPFSSEVLHLKFDESFSGVCFDGTSEFCDSSPYQNDFECNACQTGQEYFGITTSGKFGKAYDGNGTRNASRSDDSDFDFTSTDDFTISFWYRADNATNPSSSFEYLLSKYFSASPGYRIYANSSDQICFGIDDDATFDPDVASCTSSDFYDTTWHHVVAVRDYSATDKTYIYIDGILRDSDTDTTTASLENGGGLYLSELEGTNNGNEFTGDIDELFIFRSALTSDQVKLLFNQAKSSVMGAVSSESSGGAGDQFSFFREYCVPGDSSTCTAPVIHLPFDENTGTKAVDFSSNSNNASFLNSAYYWRPGKIGQALEIDNVTGFQGAVADVNELDVTTAYTFEAWIYPHSLSANYNALFTKGASMYWAIKDSTNKNIEVNNGTSYLSSNNVITLNTWQHVAVTFDGTTLKYYINGVQDTTTHTASVSFVANTSNLIVGNSSGGTRPFDGLIDDFRMYGYARTPAQIMWDYNKGGPVAWWKFDESSWTNDCSTDTVYDSSENAIHGDSCPNTTGQTTPVSGKRNTAIDFDGSDDYIQVTDNSKLDIGSEESLSVSAWFNRGSATTTDVILAKDNDISDITDDGFSLYITSAPDDVRFQVGYGGGSVQTADSSTTFTTSGWHHVVGVLNQQDDTVKIFVDGVLEGSLSVSSGFGPDNSLNFVIGAESDGGNPFDGMIDDVKVFRYPLTAQQVKDEYNQGALRFGPETGSP